MQSVLLTALFACVAGMVSAQIVTNGGFEDFPFDDPVHSAGESFGGWTVGLGYAGVTFEDPNTAHAGLGSLGMVSWSSVYQDISTRPGVVYEVSFWQCCHGDSSSPGYLVRWDDSIVVGSASENAWRLACHTFTAAGTITRLALGSTTAGLSYDDVNVVPVHPALRISLTAGSSSEVSWPTNHVGYFLESAPTLTAALWSPITNRATVSGDQFTVVLRGGEQQRYIRLRQP